MKTTLKATAFILFVMACSYAFSQEPSDKSNQELDVKLRLLDAKMELLDARLKLLDFKKTENSAFKERKKAGNAIADTMPPVEYKSAIMLNPTRLFEGTFQIGYEKKLSNKLSFFAAGIGTYVTQNGLGSGYVKAQKFSSFIAETNSYRDYYGQMISGAGLMLQFKNYLLPKVNPESKAPLGLYAAPQIMYRHAWITGEYTEWVNMEFQTHRITKEIDIFSGGVVLGGKFSIAKVLCIDIYAGGVMRLSKYTDEKSFTKFKNWKNIDYSGVLPTAGINIGILK